MFTIELPVPTKEKDLSGWCVRLQQRIAAMWGSDVESVTFRVLHAAPAQLRPGMEVYADGTNWNPGSGEGKYVRNAANSAWRYLG